jgi:hypothetical protein
MSDKKAIDSEDGHVGIDAKSSSKKMPTSHQWTASEYVSVDKSLLWYFMLALGSFVVGALLYVVTKDVIGVFVVGIFAIAMGIFAGRPAKILNYTLDSSGLMVDQKQYSYAAFKSFAVIEEGAIDCVWLISLKRFSPPVAMYFDPKDEQIIIDLLSEHLPMEERKPDGIDNFMTRIGF